MGTNTILVAIADPQALADVGQALGTGWMPTSVRTEPEAVAQLKRYSFNALLVDFNLGSPDASGLLDLAMAERPETVRFLLAYEADLALVAAKVQGPHHVLPKPLELDSIKSRIEEGVADQSANGTPRENEAVAGQPAGARIPAVYSEVLKAMDSPEVTSGQVGEIIGRDETLTAEVLRLAGSSYLGLPRNLTQPAQAVESLGMEAVKALVMARRFLAEHSHLQCGYLSLDDLWQHSTRVAQIARDLVLFETKDRALAAEAFAAGLVHDLGMVVLVTNFDDLYGRVHSLAQKQPVALWDIEKEMFGANHGEIGGCLVGMWNLPGSIVEATALHHEPPAGEQQQLTPLAAVHIANVLEHQLWPSDRFRVAPTIDAGFLSGLGLLQRLPLWRAAFANRNLANREPKSESTQTGFFRASVPAVPTALPLATGATSTATTAPPSASEEGAPVDQASPSSATRWVYAGMAATVLLLLALWLASRLEFNTSTPVRAQALSQGPQAAPPASAAVPAARPDEVARVEAPASDAQAAVQLTAASPAAAPPAEPEETAGLATPAADAPAAVQPVVVSTAPNPEPGSVSQPTVGQLPLPASTPPAAAAKAAPAGAIAPDKVPEFRVNGIFYTLSKPSAIVNGVTARVGDVVNGATVVHIQPNGVTLQIKGETRVLTLK
jgi:HD-like signal output (HDOD) protein